MLHSNINEWAAVDGNQLQMLDMNLGWITSINTFPPISFNTKGFFPFLPAPLYKELQLSAH